MQCEDSICVALSLGNQWEYFSHRDILGTWWNSQLQYVMCSSDDDNHRNNNNNNILSSMFHRLKDKETVGINIKSFSLTNILIHNGELACGDFHSNSTDTFGFIQISIQHEIESSYGGDNDAIHFQSLESNVVTKKTKDIIQPLYSPF